MIDTNIWISFLIGKTLSDLSEALLNDKIRVLFSEELFEELFEVLRRPKFKKYFSQNDIAELISLIHLIAKFIQIREQLESCRDPKDNFLLDLSVSGDADYLITGENDLLALNPFRGVHIITYREFQDILQNFVKNKR